MVWLESLRGTRILHNDHLPYLYIGHFLINDLCFILCLYLPTMERHQLCWKAILSNFSNCDILSHIQQFCDTDPYLETRIQKFHKSVTEGHKSKGFEYIDWQSKTSLHASSLISKISRNLLIFTILRSSTNARSEPVLNARCTRLIDLGVFKTKKKMIILYGVFLDPVARPTSTVWYLSFVACGSFLSWCT